MAWYKSQAALIVGSLLLALGLVFTALFPLSQYCKPETPKKPQIGAKNSTETAKPSSKKPTVAQVLESIHQTQKAQYASEERAKQEKSWWHTFGCEMKITDFFIATFTLWLVIIGAWQGWQLQQTVDAIQKQGDDFRAIQSAHLVIEEFAPEIIVDDRSTSINGVLKIKNVGNTVATSIDVRGGGLTTGTPPGVPPDYGDLLPTPSPKGPSLDVGDYLEHPHSSGFSSGEGRVYCSVWVAVSYRDIFGKPKIVQACYIYDSWAKRKRFTPC